MGRSLVLFNPLSNNKHGMEAAEALKAKTNDDLEFHSVLDITDYKEFLSSLMEDDKLILIGGDGTLNNFVNRTADCKISNPIYLFAAGTGNDFLLDIGGKVGELVQIDQYLKNLPTVTVKGKKYRMINGIGYGIDGYCCEVADKIRATDATKEINYTAIAIKGLLLHYKTTSAKITVDGKEYHFPKVWLAPTMHGRFYGGGMMPTPDQDRNTCGHRVSTMVMYGSGKLKTLMVFPKIFKGEHVNHTELCRVLTGQKITVEFDRPVAAQVDGETILDVTSYTVEA